MAHNRKHKRQERKAKLEEKRNKLKQQFIDVDKDTKDSAGDTNLPEMGLGGERLTLLNLIKIFINSRKNSYIYFSIPLIPYCLFFAVILTK